MSGWLFLFSLFLFLNCFSEHTHTQRTIPYRIHPSGRCRLHSKPQMVLHPPSLCHKLHCTALHPPNHLLVRGSCSNSAVTDCCPLSSAPICTTSCVTCLSGGVGAGHASSFSLSCSIYLCFLFFCFFCFLSSLAVFPDT